MRAITLSHTIATVMPLEILSGIYDSTMNERVLSFHVMYWCGLNISPQVRTICALLTTRFKVSATAKLIRNFDVLFESSALLITIRLRTFPKIPGMIMIGHMTQYITVLAISTASTSLPSPCEYINFPALIKSVTLSARLSVAARLSVV